MLMSSLMEDYEVCLLRCAGETKREAKEMSGSGGVGDKSLPQKRFYRARAHSNPFSDSQFPVYVMLLSAQRFTRKFEFLPHNAFPHVNLFRQYILSPSFPPGMMMCRVRQSFRPAMFVCSEHCLLRSYTSLLLNHTSSPFE